MGGTRLGFEIAASFEPRAARGKCRVAGCKLLTTGKQESLLVASCRLLDNTSLYNEVLRIHKAVASISQNILYNIPTPSSRNQKASSI
jgi:hypothetical protein